MFDKYESFKTIDYPEFVGWISSRSEVWKGGKMINSFNSRSKISFFQLDAGYNVKVTSPDTQRILDSEIDLDVFITGTDRLQMLRIPSNKSNSECMGVTMFRSIIGATCGDKTFRSTEPYCMNVFTENGEVTKITFALSFPEVLIEFYK